MTTDAAAPGPDAAGADPLLPLVAEAAALHEDGRLAAAVDLMREVVRRRLPAREPLDSANLAFLLQQTWDATREPDTLREAITLATHGLGAFEGEELDRRRDRLRQSWRLLHATAGIDDPAVLRDLPYAPGLLTATGAGTGDGGRDPQRLLHHRRILGDLYSLTGGQDVAADLVDVCRAVCAGARAEQDDGEEDTALLALALSCLHDATGDPAARDEAITLLSALHASASDPGLRAGYAGELAPLLDRRSAAPGDPAQTEQAIALLRSALPDAAPEHTGRLQRRLGALLSGLAHRTGAYAPLTEAAEAYRAALPALDPDEQPACTAALAATLMQAGMRARSREQVDEAAALARAEVSRAAHPPSVEQALWHTLLRSVDDVPATAEHCLDLAELAREAVARPAGDALAALRWDRLGRIMTEAARLTGDERHREEALTAGRNALRLQPSGHERAAFEANLAHALYDEAVGKRDRAALSEAADLLRRALSRLGPDDPDRPRMRGDLAGTLLVMNDLEPDPALLDEAFGHARAAAAADGGATDPLLALAGALHLRATQDDDPQAADLALDHYQRVLAHPLEPLRRAAVLANYGWLLHLRAQRPGAGTATADLRAAVDALSEAVALVPDGQPGEQRDLLHTAVSRLAVTCAGLLDGDDRDEHLDTAIPAWRTVLARSTTHGWTDFAVAAGQSAHQAHMRRYHRHHRREDLQAALASLAAALDAAGPGHPNRAAVLTSLGICHRIRFGFTSELADLDRAVEAGTQGLDATGPDDPDRAHRLGHLSAHHRERYSETGAPGDLALAVDLATAALELDPDGVTTRAHLAAALAERFQANRDDTDLSRAVDLYRAVRDEGAAAPAPSGPDGDRQAETTAMLNNLAGVLLTRYQLFAIPTDLDEGIEALTTVLRLTPPTHRAYAPRLVNAAQARLHRAGAAPYPRGAERPDPDADRDVAVGYLETAIGQLPPAGSHYRRALSALLRAYVPGGRRDPAAFDAVLARALAVVDDPEAAGPQWTNVAHNAAAALADRWERTAAAADLDRAIEIFRACAGRGGIDSVLSTLQLGTSLAHRAESGGRPGDRAEAAWVLYGLASDATVPARLRYRAVRVWFTVADRDDAAATLDGCRLLLELLALAAWPGSPREAQESWLAQEYGVPAETARLALDAGEPAAAVEFLEQGRAVLWSGALDLRSDLAEVAAADAELAGRLLSVRDELEALATASGEDLAPEPDGPGTAAPGPDPDLLAELEHAVELESAGDTDGMLAVLDGLAGADDPWIAAAAEAGRGIAFRAAGAADDAKAAFARAAATGTGHAAMAALALGDLLLEEDDLAGARAAYERAADLGDPDAAGRLRLVAVAGERRSEAARLTNSLAAEGDPEAMLHGVLRLYGEGEYAEARLLAEFLMGSADEEGQALLGGIVGVVRAQAGDVAGARAALEQALGGHDAPVAALVLGDLLVCEFTPEEARAAYRHALTSPVHEAAERARARLAALEPPAPATGPQPPPFDFGRHFAHHLPDAEGVAALRAAQAAGDTRARTQLHLALLLLSSSGDVGADAFRRTMALAGPDDEALRLFCRGMLRRQRSDVDGACAAFDAAYRRALDAADAETACLAAVHLAKARTAQDDVPGAAAAYRLAVRAGHPHLSPMAAFDFAGFLAHNGDTAGAEEAYRTVIATGHPVQSGMAAVNLGGLLLAAGDLEGARAAYVHALNGPWPDAAERARGVLARLPG
ncbi:hypothetical protein [Streptomyces sp. NPDC020983]|uniref:hypothetical protein n=1 Tax=Streptomyces sp. NPDC020983 TaxID=3365106 RepID=UPI0037A61241